MIVDPQGARRRLAIMQPTYLPWLGYLDLMHLVDVWVILDDVQFSRQSWQQRNRIKTRSGEQWLTVPVQKPDSPTLLIDEARIADRRFVYKHQRSLEHAYARAPHVELVGDLIDSIDLATSTGRLLEVNLATIEWLRARFEISTPMFRSSRFDVSPDRIERLVQLALAVGATTYCTTLGAVEYLAPGFGMFTRAGISVELYEYLHPTYDQLHPPFVPNLTALDCVLNLGPTAPSTLGSNKTEILATA